jgi:hypothetical protein
MNWKFWKKENDDTNTTDRKSQKKNRPRGLPDAIGRRLVVGMKVDPDEAWSLRYVSRALEAQGGLFEFRLFDPEKTRTVGLVVKDWSSLDDRPDLVQYTGRYNKNTKQVELLP